MKSWGRQRLRPTIPLSVCDKLSLFGELELRLFLSRTFMVRVWFKVGDKVTHIGRVQTISWEWSSYKRTVHTWHERASECTFVSSAHLDKQTFYTKKESVLLCFPRKQNLRDGSKQTGPSVSKRQQCVFFPPPPFRHRFYSHCCRLTKNTGPKKPTVK